MRVVVDHTLRRQFADGLWIFWRSLPGNAEKEALVMEVTACGNRKCPCRDAHLQGWTADGRLRVVETERKGIVLHTETPPESQPPVRRLSAMVNYETGEVAPAGSAEDEDLLAWLRAEIDGELLENAYDMWLAAKGWCQEEKPRLGPWRLDEGAMVGFDEVYPDARNDIYVQDAIPFVALDFYCAAL